MNTYKLILVAVCFCLSGLAALVYQTAWLRQFSFVFGTSDIAVVLVLSAYMAGLALGAFLAARLMRLIKRPVLFYGILEATIAGIALLFPLLLQAVQETYLALFSGYTELEQTSGFEQSLFYFAGSFFIILLPTTAMGATLPVLAKYVVVDKAHIGSRIGALYAINTLGAVFGALLTAFLLLPNLGLHGSVYFAAAINVLVFFIAWYLSHIHSHVETSDSVVVADEKNIFPPGAWIYLFAILLSGMISFAYEVLWTRLLGHILGGSVTAFATMLASFLTGIALGSIVASRWARSSFSAGLGFWICQVGIAVTALLVYHGFEYLAQTEVLRNWRVMSAILVMLPSTLFIGATFPFVVRLCATSAKTAPMIAGTVYAWNTVGAILGAILTGFVFLPLLKYEGVIEFLILANLSLAVLVSFHRGAPWRRATAAVSIVIWLAVAGLHQANTPIHILRHSFIGAPQAGDIIYYEVGRSATVQVHEHQGRYFLRTNSLPESNIYAEDFQFKPSGSGLMLFPSLARPQADSALVIGLGAGRLLESIPSSIEQVDVIELEPRVLEANQYIATLRHRDPLSDPRIQVHINDARSSLQLTEKTWDIIISQPSHPWTAGASHLYTEEFIRIVANRLSPDGVYLQWMNAGFVTEDVFAALLRSVRNVFAHVRVYQKSLGVFYILASSSPLTMEEDYMQAGCLQADCFREYVGAAKRFEDLLTGLVLDRAGVDAVSASSEPITDDFNSMAIESARLMAHRDKIKSLKVNKLYLQHAPILQSPDYRTRYLQSEENWLAAYDSMVLGRDKFLILLEEAQPRLFQFIVARKQIFSNDQAEQAQARQALLNIASERSLYFLAKNSVAQQGFEQELPEGAKEILHIHRSAAPMDYKNIATIDPLLANVTSDQAWYQDALFLRIWWRMKSHEVKPADEWVEQAYVIMEEYIRHTNVAQWRSLDLSLYLDIVSALQDDSKLLGVSYFYLSVLHSEFLQGFRTTSLNDQVDQAQLIRYIKQVAKGLTRVEATLHRLSHSVTVNPAILGNVYQTLGLIQARFTKLVLSKGLEDTVKLAQIELGDIAADEAFLLPSE